MCTCTYVAQAEVDVETQGIVEQKCAREKIIKENKAVATLGVETTRERAGNGRQDRRKDITGTTDQTTPLKEKKGGIVTTNHPVPLQDNDLLREGERGSTSSDPPAPLPDTITDPLPLPGTEAARPTGSNPSLWLGKHHPLSPPQHPVHVDFCI